MALQPPTYIYDAVLAFDGGVDSYTLPAELPKNTLAFAVNCTVRNDFISTRSPYRKINLSGDSIPSGLFQEACYYQPDAGVESIFSAIGGRLIQFIPDSLGGAVVKNQTQNSGGQVPITSQNWMWQSENFLIWQDGQSLPIFFDGSLTRRSLGNMPLSYGIISAAPAIFAPVIGESVVVNLEGMPLSTFAQTVLLNGAYYTVAPYGSVNNEVNLQTLSSPKATPVISGTPLISNPSQLAVLVQSYNLGTDPSKCRLIVDYGANFNVGDLLYLPGLSHSLPVTVDAVSGNTVDVHNTDHQGIQGSTPGGIITRIVTSVTAIVGTLASDFGFGSVGTSVNVALQQPFVGTTSSDVWLADGHFLLESIPSVNAVVITNVDDSSVDQYPVNLAGMTIYSLPELPAGRMGTYGLGRNWQSGIDGISYLGGDIVGYSSGSAAYNFRDAVLKMTANQTLLVGNFRVPGAAGQITGMVFPAQLDTSLGQGPLQVFCQRSIFSCLAPIDASAWQATTNPLQVESLKGNGAASHWSIVLSNADIFFKSHDDQVRSLLLARLDYRKWGDTPIGLEMGRIFDDEDSQLLNFISGVEFDNRMLMTATPTQGSLGVYHTDLVAYNYDAVSSSSNKSDPVWEGTWRGLNILKVVTGFFGGVQRTFAFVLNTTSNSIELWEIEQWTGDPVFDNGSTPVTMQFETPCFFNQTNQKSPFDLCQLIDGEIYADSMQGVVNFLIEYQPDFDTEWHVWNSWSLNAGDTPSYRTRMGFGSPPDDFNNPMLRQTREGYFFQLRVTISGPARVRGIRLKASILPQPDFAPIIPDAANPVPASP